MFKISSVAKQLMIDPDTVKNWIARDELKDFFSAAARGDDRKLQRRLEESDLIVLNTVRVLRAQNMEWDEIADRIRAGTLNRELPFERAIDLGATTRMQIERSLVTVQERDNALAQVGSLENEIRDLKAALEREKAASEQKIRELELKLHELEKAKAVEEAKAALELELWRTGQLKAPPKPRPKL